MCVCVCVCVCVYRYAGNINALLIIFFCFSTFRHSSLHSYHHLLYQSIDDGTNSDGGLGSYGGLGGDGVRFLDH